MCYFDMKCMAEVMKYTNVYATIVYVGIRNNIK